jgi:hypothetical protein
MRAKWVSGLILAGFAAATAAAQTVPTMPGDGAMYCSGMITTENVPQDSYIISGEESQIKLTFFTRDLVYINRGADQGVKEGDKFDVMRAEKKDPLDQEWFKGQFAIMRAMGTKYADMGRLRVVHVGPKVSTATVEFACDLMQRGDLVMPFVERPAPQYKESAPIDIFAPISAKATAGMLVSTRSFGQTAGSGSVAYINLGSTEGLKVGSYVRVFRYAGPTKEVVPQEQKAAYAMYGWGSAPVKYTPEQLPREILGEAIVIRATAHTATVLITAMRNDMYVGDYVEVEQ